MPIPESQLKTWSNQGATVGSANTYKSVKNALKSYSFPIGMTYDVYLQGSYPNHTNIRGDSDVDIVIETNGIFYSNLSQEERSQKQFTPASFTWQDFRREIVQALVNYYGYSNVDDTADKCIKLKDDNGNRLPADIVPCAEYHRYHNSTLHAVGMTFFTKNYEQIINYPKIHRTNGTAKNERTYRSYKSNVRVFKNARNQLTSKSSQFPSYFLECLLYNISDTCFGYSYAQTFECVLRELCKKRDLEGLEKFVTQNEQDYLFGFSSWQTSKSSAVELINDFVELWNNW